MSEEIDNSERKPGLSEAAPVSLVTATEGESLYKTVQDSAKAELTQRRRTKAPAVSVDPVEAQSSEPQIEKPETGVPAKIKRSFAKKLSSTDKPPPDEVIVMESIELEPRKSALSQPIPTGQTTPIDIEIKIKPKKSEITQENESLVDDVAELPSPDTKLHSEWSDDEEAGGLPRTESRASRVSRAVRQLFCCGRPVEAASEDNISGRDGGAI